MTDQVEPVAQIEDALRKLVLVISFVIPALGFALWVAMRGPQTYLGKAGLHGMIRGIVFYFFLVYITALLRG